MTCIIGMVCEDGVYLGGDRVASDGHMKHTISRPKVFKKNEVLIGYTSSFKMGQLLEFYWNVPEKNVRHTDDEYLYKIIPNSLQELYRKFSWKTKSDDMEYRWGTFLLAWNGRLIEVQDNLSVMECISGVSSCGSGGEVAMASVLTSLKQGTPKHPEKIIEDALKVASEMICTVSLGHDIIFLPNKS